MAAQPSDDRARLTETARKFEAAFLAEALNHMGLDATKGVEGASAFSSFVNRAYADGLMARGGIGLSESIVRALAQREDAGQGGT
jgi:Rod binding domain-containing protein